MTVATHGMNVQEVQRLGGELQRTAGDLDEAVRRLEHTLQAVLWVGPDADAFKGQWWPDHRRRLAEISMAVYGFGQSALNNASAQLEVSGAGSSSAAPGAQSDPGQAAVDASDSPPSSSTYSQHFTDGSTWTDDWHRRGEYDQWNFGYDGDGDAQFGNCTSFVAWRLNQLGAAGGSDAYRFDNNSVTLGEGDTVAYGRLGNAYEWYDNAGGRFRTSEPSVGSVVVWERGDGMAMRSGADYGHVAIVRAVGEDGSITIEESSWDSTTYRTRTLATGDYPDKFLNFLP